MKRNMVKVLTHVEYSKATKTLAMLQTVYGKRSYMLYQTETPLKYTLHFNLDDREVPTVKTLMSMLTPEQKVDLIYNIVNYVPKETDNQ